MSQLYDWGIGLPAGTLYLFIFAWLFIETTGFPISDEPLLLLAGYLTSVRRLELAAVIGLALVGKVAASLVAYWLGRHIPLERFARSTQPGARTWGALEVIRPTQQALKAVEDRFNQQGAWAIFIGRLIPVVRSFISYPAGAARMPLMRFFLATTAGSFLWIVIWTTLGAVVGDSYQMVAARWGQWSWVVFVALALGALGIWAWRHWRGAHP